MFKGVFTSLSILILLLSQQAFAATSCPDGSEAESRLCVINRSEIDPGLVCYDKDLNPKIFFAGYRNVHAVIDNGSAEHFTFVVGDDIYLVNKSTLEITNLPFSSFDWSDESEAPQMFLVRDHLQSGGGDALFLADLIRGSEIKTELILVDGDSSSIRTLYSELDGAEWIAQSPVDDTYGLVGGSFGIKKLVRSESSYSLENVIAISDLPEGFGTIKNTSSGIFADDGSQLIFTVTNSESETTAIYTYDIDSALLTEVVGDNIPYMIPRGGLQATPEDPYLLASAGTKMDLYTSLGSFASDEFPISYTDLSPTAYTSDSLQDTGSFAFVEMCDGTPQKGPYTDEACDGIDNDGDVSIDENLTKACDESLYKPGTSTCENGNWIGCEYICAVEENEVLNPVTKECECEQGYERDDENNCIAIPSKEPEEETPVEETDEPEEVIVPANEPDTSSDNTPDDNNEALEESDSQQPDPQVAPTPNTNVKMSGGALGCQLSTQENPAAQGYAVLALMLGFFGLLFRLRRHAK
ncbi:MAG: hypothetical protein H7A33_04510 [Deltaproteobacteria bacterium]|nr:hypothetical protein [Deltaproteobacteria bacterium]